ncbi:uncharacterized protein MONBRDRAFT_13868 [Monosiga brevicollis MX1]|uniref:Peptidase S54 rhomboid domain-containing protein n=1 Tax=Monosiga brevicollis TaxID=81824 RepID=A9UNI6_MONBE|nr:uncharacterized protein MONBRDRAFT_13868 [Monosiga brevicollis MX1]EDQ93145.1 predicted protein [Monosiga brevicollis MX1]|eukprot:XP_001742907.1 hypothetical protein [Monosiga brevicollis MX1]
MRNDISVQVARATQTEAEATLYGCCERRSGNESAFVTCGVTLEYDCPATWLGAGSVCASNCDDQRLAPCCLHNNGTCAIVTSSYCDALGGTYHPEAQRCGEVNCLRDSCGPGGSAENPDQGWRILTALFMHAGAIHLLVMLYVQLSVGVPLERKAGWLRIALIYLISGCGGNLVSALFVPNSAQVGASGAVYGLVATALVDLMHCWRLLKSPWVQLGTYLIQTAVLLLLGTTPWLDNFAHVGGFLFGLLGGIVFLPYVTFGAWDKFRKRLLLVICFPALVLAFLVVLVLFYRVQNTNFCPGCERIQCVDWVKGLCDNGAVSEA